MDELKLSITRWFGNRTLPIDSEEWRALRKRVMERDDYTCRFCGIRSLRWMVCDHMDGHADNNNINNLGVNCPPCDAIRHCGFSGLNGWTILCISDMPQVEIIRKTLQYYREFGVVPGPATIDPAAKTCPVSMVMYANALGSPDSLLIKYGDTLKRFRGFFTPLSEELFQRVL